MPRAKPRTAETLRGPGTTGEQDVAIILATRIGLVVFGLLIQGLLAWLLLPEGRGSYAVCVAFGTLLGLLFTPGTCQGAQYFVAARQTSVSQGVSSILAICLVGGALATFLATTLIHSDIAFFQKAQQQSFHLALVLIPLTAFSVAIEHQLAALRRFSRVGMYALLRSMSDAIAILVLAGQLDMGVNGAILAAIFGHVVMVSTCLRDLRRHCGLVAEIPSRTNLTRILGYGFSYHIARIGGVLELQVGVLILGLLASPAEIGLFSAASTLILGLRVLSNSVGNALLPRIAGREHLELVGLCLRFVFGLTAIALLSLLAISVPLIQIMLSDDFLPAVSLIWILAPGVLAYACSGILTTHFKGANLPGVCSWAVCLGLVVNAGVLVLLYPQLGVHAAAWSMAIGMLCCCLLLAVIYRRTTQMSWLSTWMPRRSDLRFLWTAGRRFVWAYRSQKNPPLKARD